jgi:transcriptional regulator with XRE-family HTH domain
MANILCHSEKVEIALGENADFIELLPVVQSALLRYRRERRLSELARNIGFSKNRLTELMHGKRKLTPYYLLKLIEAGVMTPAQLFGEPETEDLPPSKRILARRLLIDPVILDVLDEEIQLLLKETAEQNRVDDLKTILKTILKK